MRLYYDINIKHWCSNYYYVNGHLVSFMGLPDVESVKKLYPIFLELIDIPALKYFCSGYLLCEYATQTYKIYKLKGDQCRVAKTQYFYDGLGRMISHHSTVECSISSISYLFRD